MKVRANLCYNACLQATLTLTTRSTKQENNVYYWQRNDTNTTAYNACIAF